MTVFVYYRKKSSSDDINIFKYFLNIEKIEFVDDYYLLFEPGTDFSTCIHISANDFTLTVQS